MKTLLFLIAVIFQTTLVFAGSLSVGTKVIYPGGTDQPPKEKDTGVSFNADIVGLAADENIDEEKTIEHFKQMLEEEDYDNLLQQISDRNDPESLALKSLALYYQGSEPEALELAGKLLKNPKLSDQSKQKICEELSLEMPEEEENEN